MISIELAVHVAIRAIQIFWRFVLRNVYGSRRNELPPIMDKIVLESASSLAAKIRARKLKSEDVVRAFITRIQQVNPSINAVVDDRFVDAIEDAKKVDAYLQANNPSENALLAEKPFLGVPFTTKNAIGVKGLIMDAGVMMKKGATAPEDSDVVANMRKAGAIPLCVTNVPEYCMWFDASNKLYGRTNNPYDLTKISGGSTGGEGALITSAGSVIGIGNDIGGSVRNPSFNCGIFGHKGTRRTISNKGQYPSSYQTAMDHYNMTGPMCRYSEDLLPMFKVLIGENASKLKLDTQVDVKKLKVYYAEDYIDDMFTSPVSEEMKNAVTKVVSHLEKTFGITAQKVAFAKEMRLGFVTWVMKMSTEDGFLHYDKCLSNKILNVPLEILKWACRLSKHTLHAIWFMAAVKYTPTRDPKSELRERLNNNADKLQQDIQTTLGDNGVFIFPPNNETAVYHQELALHVQNVVYTTMFSILGLPVTQCPTGLSKDGLPLGVQVIGNYHNDHLTIAVAKEIEKAFGGWKTPCPII